MTTEFNKCPTCKELGRKSSFHISNTGISTCVAGDDPYYDKEGNYHIHDPNSFTKTARCSKGHRFRIVSYSECPSCDYNHNRSTITQIKQ